MRWVLALILLSGCAGLGWEVHLGLGRTFQDASYRSNNSVSAGFFEPEDEEVITNGNGSSSLSIEDATTAMVTFVLKGPTPIRIIKDEPLDPLTPEEIAEFRELQEHVHIDQETSEVTFNGHTVKTTGRIGWLIGSLLVVALGAAGMGWLWWKGKIFGGS